MILFFCRRAYWGCSIDDAMTRIGQLIIQTGLRLSSTLVLPRIQSESSLSSSSPERLRFLETAFGTSSFLTKT